MLHCLRFKRSALFKRNSGLKYLQTFSIFCLQFLGFGLSAQTRTNISADNALIQYTGRIDYSNPKAVKYSHPGTSIKMKFEGQICHIHLGNESSSNMANYYNLILDNEKLIVISVQNDTLYKLSLSKGTHTVEITKRTESFVGKGIFKGFEIEKGKKLLPLEKHKRKIEFIGNSITCGYGNEGSSPLCHFTPDTENNYLSFGAITARKLNADYMAVAVSGIGVIRNYDLAGETMPVIYDQIFPDKKTPVWDFKKWTPDVVVVNLGTNDFAHSAPDSVLFVSTYFTFLKRIRKNYPNAHIFCIEGSMIKDGWPVGVASLTLVKRFVESAIIKFKKEQDSKIDSFYLSTAKESDLGCDYHPNVKMHQQMAEELTGFIMTKMNW